MKDGELDEKIMDELTAGENEGMDQEMWDQLNGGRDMGEQEQAGGFEDAGNFPE